MARQEITLTREELAEIKEVEGFRAKVVLELKRLNGLPERVAKLEVKIWFVIIGVPLILSVAGLILKALDLYAR